MHRYTLTELSCGLKDKSFSSKELTQHFLQRIADHDPELNSFISVTAESALNQADTADQTIAAGNNSALTGIPFAHKDIFCTKGVRTSCASKMLDNFVAPYDAAVVERLSPMVMLGKTNMDEFAMGSSNETSFYGPVKNPWDSSRVPGGSSGGSAAAVAARLVPATTGTDTGGSIRQPAALCGITGLKPTYGRVSRWGMVAFASSLDQAGPMTQTAADAALMLQAMAGFDPRDSTSLEQAVPDYSKDLSAGIEGLKIGLPKQYFTSGLDSGIAAALDSALKVYESLGAKLVEIDLNTSDLAVPAYYVIAPAECSSNLSRFDGVRFGYRCENPVDLDDLYKRSRGEGFGKEVKRRIMIGAYTLSAGYYDAYYIKAQKVRRLIKQDFDQAFSQVDLIAAPSTPTNAFKIGEKCNDPISMYLSDIYTIATNLAGLPGLSMPVGMNQSMPVGMQLIGNHFEEAKLLNAAHKYQEETQWHRELPPAYR